MRVLVACEESQTVCKAFRKAGHEAFSCDVLPCSGNRPEWHIQCDVRALLLEDWDLIIAFPPCQHLCASGARWWLAKQADGRQQTAINFFLAFTDLPAPRIAIENSIGLMSRVYRKPDQIVHPYYFGDAYTKATCLWLKNLPLLKPTKVVKPDKLYIVNAPDSKGRARRRAKTPEGLAAAMASQWA